MIQFFSSGDCSWWSNSRFQVIHLSCPEFKVYSLRSSIKKIIARLHLAFSTSLSFYHPFITGVLHGGSTWWFIKDSFHSSIVLQDFSRSYDLPSYTQKLNMVLNTCFVLRSSIILHLAFRSAILSINIFWGGVMSFLIISIHVSWFTCCQEWGILSPSISSLELSW